MNNNNIFLAVFLWCSYKHLQNIHKAVSSIFFREELFPLIRQEYWCIDMVNERWKCAWHRYDQVWNRILLHILVGEMEGVFNLLQRVTVDSVIQCRGFLAFDSLFILHLLRSTIQDGATKPKALTVRCLRSVDLPCMWNTSPSLFFVLFYYGLLFYFCLFYILK